jgi:hypothetical protein
VLPHPGNSRLHGIERAENVDVEKLAEMIDRLVGYKGSAAKGCIVDQNVKMSIIVTGRLDQMLHLELISHISSKSQCLIPKLSQFFSYCIDRLT